jgi:hypothetical protein
MARKTLLPGYTRLPGKAARIITPENEEISQRQYRKIVREKSGLTPFVDGKKVISNEALAKFNRTINFENQLARPARGRTGLSKLTEAQREKEKEKRKAAKIKKEIAEREAKENAAVVRKLNRKIKAAGNKKAKKFSINSLKAGRLAYQLDFYTYAEFKSIIKDAQKSGKVPYFALGIRGVDERDGKTLTATLTGLMDIKYNFTESRLDEETDDFIENHAYMLFLNWFVHLSFSKDYALRKAERAGVKLGHRPKRK